LICRLHEALAFKVPSRFEPFSSQSNQPEEEDQHEEEEEDSKKKEYEMSIVNDLFQGMVSSTITCSRCSHASTTSESFLDLSLPVLSPELLLEREGVVRDFIARVENRVRSANYYLVLVGM